jgi:hypothetical protein
MIRQQQLEIMSNSKEIKLQDIEKIYQNIETPLHNL